jgi:hypothetical protein
MTNLSKIAPVHAAVAFGLLAASSVNVLLLYSLL